MEMSDLKKLTDVKERELQIAGRNIDRDVRKRGDSENNWPKRKKVTGR